MNILTPCALFEAQMFQAHLKDVNQEATDGGFILMTLIKNNLGNALAPEVDAWKIFMTLLLCGHVYKMAINPLYGPSVILFVWFLLFFHLFSGEELLRRMKGEQVTPRYLERHGFNYPIMVTEMEGLGLKLPPQTFSVKDVEQYVGKNR